MREMENKEIGQIRFEFTDGSWFIVDQMKLRHLKTETKLEMDFALSKVFEELEAIRIQAGESDTNENTLGIDVNDTIKTKDVGPGQK